MDLKTAQPFGEKESDRRPQQRWRQILVKNMEGYLYLLPALALAAAFCYYPFLKTLLHSVSLVDTRGRFVRLIGLENFRRIFETPQLSAALFNTLRYIAMEIPLSLLFALTLALIANKRRRFSNIYQTLFAMPMAVSMAITCLIFNELFDANVGWINFLLDKKIFWFDDPAYAMLVIVILITWTSVGFPFMLLLAAFRGVPQDLIENAELAGANYFQRLRHVILPLISPTLFFLLITKIASGMVMVGPVMIMTQGGPQNSTQTLVHYIYTTTFMGRDYSSASVASLITFVLTFGMLLISFLYEKKGVFYE